MRRRVLLLSATLLGAALSAHAAKITEATVPTANGQPYTIVLGPDGKLWFTEVNGNKIGAVTVNAGAMSIADYLIPTPSSGPIGIAPGPAGQGIIYFTKTNTGALGVVNLAGGFSADVVTGLNGPSQIVAGPDGRMWLTETGASDVFAYAYYLYSPANGLCATLTASAGPIGITSGIVGGIAFTEDTANKLAFVALSGTDFCTVVREATIPTASSHPRRIVAVGQDVWFTENGANQIGRYNYNANHFDEYPIPTPASAPLGITLGPDGNVWFTEYAGNKIGRITPAGVVTEYTIPTAGSGPSSICLGPDGALYFTENITNKIGRLRVFIQGDVNDDGVVDIADVFYTINFLFAGGPPPK